MNSISIITDSCCDLSLKNIEHNNINIISTPVSFGEESYRDRDTITLQQFYSRLAEGETPSTSQIPPEDYLSAFQKELEAGNKVIAICFSGELSGIYESALLAKKQIDSEDIAVIDSRSASLGLGLTVLKAAEAVENGCSWEEVIAEVEENCRYMEHIFAVGKLEMLKRGGRISGGKALIGNILNVKPILHFEAGKIKPLSKVRGIDNMVDFLVEKLQERGNYNSTPEFIGISHSNDRELAEKLQIRIEEKVGSPHNLDFGEIGAAVGSHVGSGTVALFFKGQEPVAEPEIVI